MTLFALILSLGLLVDDPIVDVENIARHFAMRGKATRAIVLEAVAEIRPPLISATLAVIVSFLPMFFITGMMGPYMAPMALNVPVAMLMSMVVAFTITPWMAYQVLHRRFDSTGGGGHGGHDPDDPDAIRQTTLYKIFYPLMRPLLHSRLTAAGVPPVHRRPDRRRDGPGRDEGRSAQDAALRQQERAVARDGLRRGDHAGAVERGRAGDRVRAGHVPEVTNFTSYVGVSSPIDFNGLVRHYYLRQMPHQAEIRINLVGKKQREAQSHALALRLHDPLTKIAERHKARIKIVELPPGPPVLSSIVAEVYGRPDNSYADLIAASRHGRRSIAEGAGGDRGRRHVEAPAPTLVFLADQEKAALNGVSVDEIARTLQVSLSGATVGTVRLAGERNPLAIELRLPRSIRSSAQDLAGHPDQGPRGQSRGARGNRPLGDASGRPDDLPQEPGTRRVRLRRDGGTSPAECVLDVTFDRRRAETGGTRLGRGYTSPDRWPSATTFRMAAASPGLCPKGCASSSPARASGRSRSTSSATLAWPSARRC